MLLKLLVILFTCMQLSSFLSLAYAGELEDSRSTVGTSTSTHPLKMGRRRMFTAEGRFWMFYQYAGTYIGYRSSLDGNSWTTLTTLVQVVTNSFSLFYDNSTYVHLAYGGLYGYGYYMRGNPNSDGSITWDGQKTFWASANTITGCSITANSTGYPFISFHSTSGSGDIYLTHSNLNNGTWLDASGFPLLVNGTATSNAHTQCLMLENQNVSITYGRSFSPPSEYIASYLYFRNNASLSAYERASSLTFSDSLEAVAVGNDIYLAYYRSPDYVQFTKRTYLNSTWPTHNETDIANTNGQTGVVLSYDYVNGRVYIIKSATPSDSFVLNVTYYSLSAQTFTTAEIVSDNGQHSENFLFQCSYMVYNYTLTIAYVYPLVTPYTVRHVYYDFYTAPPPEATVYPIRLTMGLIGLLFIIMGPTVSIRMIKKSRNPRGILMGFFLFMFGYALLCAWMY